MVDKKFFTLEDNNLDQVLSQLTDLGGQKMEYRAVGNRCAVILSSLHLSISDGEILAVLKCKGFVLEEVDIVALARQCVDVSQYCLGTKLSEAPVIVDCSSFTKWLYGRRGIWLPRLSIQQRELGEVTGLDKLVAGDLVFTSGRIGYFDNNPMDDVGHVGVATGVGTVIHAANKKAGVVETPLEKFVGKTKFRGARRFVPQDVEALTFKVPLDIDV